MRDPKRIRKVLNQIADVWETNCPDWRLGQLLDNVTSSSNVSNIFYIEDEDLVDAVKKYFERKN